MHSNPNQSMLFSLLGGVPAEQRNCTNPYVFWGLVKGAHTLGVGWESSQPSLPKIVHFVWATEGFGQWGTSGAAVSTSAAPVSTSAVPVVHQ